MAVRFEAWECCQQLAPARHLYQHARLMDTLIAAKPEPELIWHEDMVEIIFRHENRGIELYLAKNSAWSRISAWRHLKDSKLKIVHSIENPSPEEVRKLVGKLNHNFEVRFDQLILAGYAIVRIGFRLAAYLCLITGFLQLLKGNFDRAAIDAFLSIVIWMGLEYGRIFKKKEEE